MSLPGGKRKSPYSKSRREVQDKLRFAERDLHMGLDLSATSQTVGQFLERWLEDVARPTVRPSTYQSYAHHVRYHLRPAIGHIQLAKLTPQHVQTLLNEGETGTLTSNDTADARDAPPSGQLCGQLILGTPERGNAG